MSFIILIIISIFLCWKYGDWKNWRLYYPTILYMVIGNLTCDILVYRNPLWSYTINFLNHIYADLLVISYLFRNQKIFLHILTLSLIPSVAFAKQIVFMYFNM
jgi:hypothetical protein